VRSLRRDGHSFQLQPSIFFWAFNRRRFLTRYLRVCGVCFEYYLRQYSAVGRLFSYTKGFDLVFWSELGLRFGFHSC